MVKTFDFDLIKNVIEEAIHSCDFHNLKVFEDTLSKIIRELRNVISTSLIPNQSDFITLKRMKFLYFLIMNDMN